MVQITLQKALRFDPKEARDEIHTPNNLVEDRRIIKLQARKNQKIIP